MGRPPHPTGTENGHMIVAAAIQLRHLDSSPVIVLGAPANFALPAAARHPDVLPLVHAALRDRARARLPEGPLVQVQGFIDASRGFVERVAAREIVGREQQALRTPLDGARLYSENLW